LRRPLILHIKLITEVHI